MYKHLLVPLDGSRLAEIVLPTVNLMAAKLGARITLFHVLEKNVTATVHGQKHHTREDEALAYLKDVASQSIQPGIQVDCHVHTNPADNVALSLVEHAAELHPDLIVMCVHGSGGLRDVMSGSVAQQVLAYSVIPVLLVKPPKPETPVLKLDDFLIALDGNPEHEEGLNSAAGLSEALGARMTLINVIHTYDTLPTEKAAVGRLLPGSTALMLDMLEEEAEQYLKDVANCCCREGNIVRVIVERGNPVDEILDAASRLDCDLIVLGTHGKSGLEAFWGGSVGAQIINQSINSVLLVPARHG
jgi:nucleotide-binding universal stress UspA family protein